MSYVDQIGEMSVEVIALAQLARDASAGCRETTGEAVQLIEQINALCCEITNSEAAFLENKIKRHTMWIANCPVAYA